MAARDGTGEAAAVLRHAGTVLAGQLAVMAFGMADTIVAGRFSGDALAALSVGSAIFVSVFVALMGVVQALLPVWAEMHGAGERAAVGRSVRQALYICGPAALLGCALLLFPGPVLRWTDVPPALRADVERYLAILALALPATLLFRLYSTFNQALGKPHLVTVLQVGSVVLKIPFTIWFTFGGLGLAPQGVAGCAWGTVVDSYAVLLVALWLLWRQDFYRPFAFWRLMERPDPRMLARFMRLGLPAGLGIAVEVTSFTLMALFIARQGTVSLAAHQIAANVGAVLYMVPLSLAIASSARASYWLGAGRPVQARAAAWLGLRMAGALAIVLSAVLFMLRTAIAGGYSTEPAIIATAAGLLGWVALYHLADAVQTVCVFLLRSWRITVSTLLIYSLLLWGLGLGGGLALAYRGVGPVAAWHSPAAFWAAAVVALALTALVFPLMLARAVRRPLPSDAAGAAPAA